MAEIKIIKVDGSEHVLPEENLPNLRRILGKQIKKVVSLSGVGIAGAGAAKKPNRKALEDVVKREQKWPDDKIKKATDEELMAAISAPQK